MILIIFLAHRARVILWIHFIYLVSPWLCSPREFPYSHYGIKLDWVQQRTLYLTMEDNKG